MGKRNKFLGSLNDWSVCAENEVDQLFFDYGDGPVRELRSAAINLLDRWISELQVIRKEAGNG
jgi:hypothetical protein